MKDDKAVDLYRRIWELRRRQRIRETVMWALIVAVASALIGLSVLMLELWLLDMGGK